MKALLASLLTAAALLLPALGHATPDTFSFNATGADIVLDGLNMNDLDFTARLLADTGKLTSNGGVLQHTDLLIPIQFNDGVNLSFGNGNIYVNQTVGSVGFGVGKDLFDFIDPSYFTYVFVSSFGPVSSNRVFALEQRFAIPTTAGLLSVTEVETGSFSAELQSTPVPEPAALTLVVLGLAGVAFGHRRASSRYDTFH